MLTRDSVANGLSGVGGYVLSSLEVGLSSLRSLAGGGRVLLSLAGEVGSSVLGALEVALGSALSITAGGVLLGLVAQVGSGVRSALGQALGLVLSTIEGGTTRVTDLLGGRLGVI